MPSFHQPDPPGEVASAGDRPRAGWVRWSGLALLITIVASAVLLLDLRTLLREALVWIERLGSAGPFLFILLYIVATVLLIPGSALTLGAGALFGVVRGSIYASIAATLGATAAFLVGRYLARDWVAKKIATRPTFTAIDRAVAEEGWKIVGLTRLTPILPFTLLNYAFGLTQVRLRDYLLASWIGMMPGTVLYVYLGALAGAGVSGRQRTPAEWALYGVGLVATILVTVKMTRLAREALARRTQPHS